MFSAIALALHALFAVVWVGGMVFAYAVLRPPAAGLLEPPERLRLWDGVFAKFFLWVWHAVAILPATGYFLVFWTYDGFSGAGIHIHLMQMLGWGMIGIFIWLFFAPYRRFKSAVAEADWPTAAHFLAVIRRTVGFNTVLGLVTVAIGAGGRFWG